MAPMDTGVTKDGQLWYGRVSGQEGYECQVEAMCSESGLEVVWTRFVRAGRWHEALAEDDDRAKEILVLCRTHP